MSIDTATKKSSLLIDQIFYLKKKWGLAKRKNIIEMSNVLVGRPTSIFVVI